MRVNRFLSPDAAQRAASSRRGALQSRGRNERRCVVRSRFCEAALKKRCIAPGTRGYLCNLTPSITTVAAELDSGWLESRISRRTVPLIQRSRFSL
jgi:hypothetical protein